MDEENVHEITSILYYKTFAVEVKAYGEEHTDTVTATATNNIVLTMKENSDLLIVYKRCTARVLWNALWEEHTVTAEIYTEVALVTKARGALDGVLKMSNKCLVIEEKVLGEEQTLVWYNVTKILLR